MSDASRAQPGRKGSRMTLFVGNLPENSIEELEQAVTLMFAKHGKVEECEVLQDKVTQASRGFAFVRMESTEAAREAKASLEGTAMPGGGPLKVRWALDTSTLYVADLAPSITDSTLREAFRQFGEVRACHVEMQPAELGGRSKMCGFVEFAKASVASEVQQLLSDNLFVISHSPRPVHVEFAFDTSDETNEGKAVSSELQEEPPPHFAVPGSLEFDFALKWREIALAHRAEKARLAEVHRQEREILRHEQSEAYKRERDKFFALERPFDDAAQHRFHRHLASDSSAHGRFTATDATPGLLEEADAGAALKRPRLGGL